ncbi:protein-glutamine glutaminase family protein [Pendulispora albinea]|uniref:Protein glutaminase domain-containing protein n=1 Tax=Pendulispora albinea TaxID=2741071 RepID=A0ABZ2LWG4_9BACT
MRVIHNRLRMKAHVVAVIAVMLPVAACVQASDEQVDESVGASGSELSAADENSAARFANETYEAAARRHDVRYRTNHKDEFQLGPTAKDSQVPVSQADMSGVPTWSDADILAHFEKSRDLRFMTTSNRPTFQRRISWLYPDDGCFARAELVNAKAAEWGKGRPYHLFSFGNLTVRTNNHPNGSVSWWYHTVPIVKSASSGEIMVLDAALDAKKPIPWKTWLLMQVSNLNNVKVSVCDGNAYGPSSSCFGSGSATSSALSAEEGTYLQREWDRQTSLGRDPNKVLGDSPPWGGGGTPSCDGTSYTGNLASGASALQPGTDGYTSGGSGTHSAQLAGPSGTDFDLFLESWNGSAWAQVSKSDGSTNNESISYPGNAGKYRWRVTSYSGSGEYTLCAKRPQ